MKAVGAQRDQSAVLSLAGDIDTATVPRLNRLADELLHQPGLADFAIDFAGNTFLDSVGLGLLVRVRLECVDRGIALQLRAVPHRVQVMLHITGLTDAFRIVGVPS